MAVHILYCVRAEDPPHHPDPTAATAVPVCREITGETLAKGIRPDGTISVTFDGLRMPRPGGWVLVLPDASEASVNVFAEGPSHGDAARYVDEIAQRVRVIAGV